MKSIRSKITATYLALALTIVVGVSILIAWKLESYVTEQLVQDLGRQADWVYYSLQRDSSMTFAQIDQQIRRVAGLENLRLTLIADDGRLIDDSDVPLEQVPQVENHLHRPEVQQALAESLGWNIRHSATVGRDFLYVARSIRAPRTGGMARDVGFVRLSMPLEDVRDRMNSLRAIVAIVGFLTLIVVIGVSVLISQRISHPIVEIARAVEQIRSGDFDVRIGVTSDDETGKLAGAINELVQKLKADIVQMRKLEKVRSEFLGNVSHELRTPIFAIQGFIETLLNGAVDDRSVNRTFLERARSNANRLNALLEDLINISQIESGEMKMSFRYFNANDFIEGVVRDFQDQGRQSRIEVSASCNTPRDQEVLGDRDRLRQVLNNLIDNGLKYNVEGGTVVVSTESLGDKIRVSVKDSGVGIPPEHVNRIFERFYRVDKDRSREVGGTGLGLAIVKHIVEAHESTIEVSSEPGKGSTFSFTLRT
ncbi:MAG TPA: ATP-binding protein [Bacteroidota bacterium]|nr:ATP-binding protein [Bacteroidota bacterium]